MQHHLHSGSKFIQIHVREITEKSNNSLCINLTVVKIFAQNKSIFSGVDTCKIEFVHIFSYEPFADDKLSDI